MNNISREYFSATEYAVSRMIEFITDNEVFDEYVEKARELFPDLVYEGNTVFLFYMDLVKCYRKLGYDFDLSKKETLAMFLSIYDGLSGEIDNPYETLDEMLREASEAFGQVVEFLLQRLPEIPEDCDFLFLNVLREIPGQEDYERQYCVILYRICSIIAKADGKISPKESRWLVKLLTYSQNTQTGRLRSVAMRELDDLIGLENVKKEVNTFANFALVQKKRAENGLKATPVSMHLVFSGNPGTGKTTVARIMGRIYKDLGLLESGHLVEADRSALVGEYIGHTAIKTNKIIDSALGGVLFIDEAYSLAPDSKEDFGAEAVSTLLKRMEDNRDNLAVILAGYSDRMEKFISSNPGLNSRFSRQIVFDDYSADELYCIYESQLEKYDYKITDEAAEAVLAMFSETTDKKPADFGNGRFARNLFERTIESQANRVAFLPNMDKATLCTIELSDIQNLR